MNTCIFTAKIVKEPNILRFRNIALSQMIIAIPNTKKGLTYFSIRVIAKWKLAKEIFDFYRKNDLVIVEGFIYLKKKQKKTSNQDIKNKIKKQIDIKIHSIHPTAYVLNLK